MLSIYVFAQDSCSLKYKFSLIKCMYVMQGLSQDVKKICLFKTAIPKFLRIQI